MAGCGRKTRRDIASAFVTDKVSSGFMGVMSGFVRNAVTVLIWSSFAVFVTDAASSQVRTSVTEVVAKVVTMVFSVCVTDVIKRKMTMPVWRVLSKPVAKAISKGRVGPTAPRTVGICRANAVTLASPACYRQGCSIP